MQLEVFFSWIDTGINFKDPELVKSSSLEMHRQTTIEGQVLILDE